MSCKNGEYKSNLVTVVNIPGDGNCLFESIRAQIKDVKSATTGALRREVVKLIRGKIANSAEYKYHVVMIIINVWIEAVREYIYELDTMIELARSSLFYPMPDAEKVRKSLAKNVGDKNEFTRMVQHAVTISTAFDKITQSVSKSDPSHKDLAKECAVAVTKPYPKYGVNIVGVVNSLVNFYLRHMETDANSVTDGKKSLVWGGDLEMAVMCEMFDLTIGVCELSPKKEGVYNIRCIGNGANVIFIIFTGNHYNAATVKLKVPPKKDPTGNIDKHNKLSLLSPEILEEVRKVATEVATKVTETKFNELSKGQKKQDDKQKEVGPGKDKTGANVVGAVKEDEVVKKKKRKNKQKAPLIGGYKNLYYLTKADYINLDR
ncbi:putative ubiquitin thioesterase OTU1 [Yasminevirus sp. GU-2018]|uniref:ubiquitinyl hydrolase 1 n=1 Tax=Yasminevirus sp. GU-2018 TaxID=2420051 RepID=A0A5K0UAV6_9VIRU|nr:putative ubiquitin thioesterase OTU1 [Yasminevirus sp. GU-2018]